MAEKVKAEIAAWLYTAPRCGGKVTDVSTDPDVSHYAGWDREPLYRLTPIPEAIITVDRIPLATSRPLDTSRREVEA